MNQVSSNEVKYLATEVLPSPFEPSDCTPANCPGSLPREQFMVGSRVSAITTSVKLWDWSTRDFLSGEDWAATVHSVSVKDCIHIVA